MNKRPSDRFGITVLALAAIIAVLLSIMGYFSTTSAPLPNLAGMIAAPFRSVSSSFSEMVENWTDYFTMVDALKEENLRLKLQIAEMEEIVRQAQDDRDENVRLREAAGLREQRRDLQWESARVLAQDTSNWASLLYVNKGTAHNVEVGDCVITETGCLVGVVTEAGMNWSTVRTILDSESSIGALVFRSKSNALAQGDFALMREGRLTLNYMGSDPNVVSGDLIVTSGLGDYYPSGLVIGHVDEVCTSDNGLAQYAVLTPDAELDGLIQVLIITSFDIVD